MPDSRAPKVQPLDNSPHIDSGTDAAFVEKSVDPESQLAAQPKKVGAYLSKGGGAGVAAVAKSTRGSPPGSKLIHPDNTRKMKWDLFVALLIIYSVISVPHSIGFDTEATDLQYGLNLFIDIVFWIDMAVTFCTAYFDSDGEVVWEWKKIAKNYIQTWFVIDFLSTLPIEDIAKAFMGSGSDSGTLRFIKLIRVLRLIRLVKLMKVLNIGQLMDELEDIIPINRNAITIMQMLLQIVFLAHLLGCFWHMTTKSAAEQGKATWITSVYGSCTYTKDMYTKLGVTMPSPEDLKLLEPEHPDCKASGIFEDDSCYACETVSLRYTASLYWAITTMATVGYGDINTQNDTERGFAVLVMLIGASIFGYTVGMMSVLVQSSDIHSYTTSQKMAYLKDYMKSRSVPLLLQKRCRKQWKYASANASVFDEKLIVASLPPSLQMEVMQTGRNNELAVLLPSLLKPSSEPLFLAAVIPVLKPFYLDDLEVLFEESSVGWHCYYIVTGAVRMSVTTPDGFIKVACTRQLDECVGHNFVLDGSVSRTSAESAGTSHVMALSRSDASSIFEDWPELETDLMAQKEAFDGEVDAFLEKEKEKQQSSSQHVKQGQTGGDANGQYGGGTNGDDEKRELQAPVRQMTPSELWSKHKIVHPDSPKKVTWDFTIGIIIVYSVIMVPFRIGFQSKPEGALLILDYVFDTMFYLDLFLTFRTAVWDEDRQLIYKPREIARKYAKLWLWIDFLSTFSFDQVFAPFVNDPAQLRIIKLLRIVRLFRLVKLFNLLKNGPLYEKFEDLTAQINAGVFRMPLLFVLLLFCAHIIACMWYGITSATEESWVKNYFFNCPEWAASNDPVLVGAVMCDDQKSTVGLYYLASFYWALATMTTVGYGDISASRFSEFEMSMAMIFMLVGTTIFAYVVGEIVMVVLNFDPAENLLKDKKMKFKAFIEEKSLSIGTKKTGRRQIQYIQSYQSMFAIDTLFSEMPEFLMQRMILNNYSDTIRMHQIFFDQVGGRFKGFEHLFVPMLKPCFSERDQYLLKAGQSSRCMFFVEKGCCQLLTSQQQEDDQGKQQWGEEQAGERFKAGQSFGQASLLAGKRKSKVTMMCSVKTVSTFAHLLELSKAKFYSIKELCPALYDFLKQEWGQGLKVEDWVAVTNTASRSKKQKRASAGSEETATATVTATAAAATVGNVKQHTQQESEGPLDA